MSRRKRSWSPKMLEKAQRVADRNKGLIEAGETFRSQAPSAYRRKVRRVDR